jgi:hypothetical protein
MSRTHYCTDISVGNCYEEVATPGNYFIPFDYDPEDSGLSATAAAVRFVDRRTMEETDIQPAISAVASNRAIVTVNAETMMLERDREYELVVTFTLSNGEKRPGMLVLIFVA